ncbi:matrixin family metalloprotease [Litoribacterium kuwaitense]|uniref:matrixin family metalloprotease n=1 Tax=Litoribacterium kuwaitense TaxID=1398745 RepID=UPI0028AA03A6|nr:matrixin family metalloprotease [Litoribacterium kuwaitense]
MAHANEKEDWHFYTKNMTYQLESGMDSLIKKGWNNAVDQWNDEGMNLYTHQSSVNRLGTINETSSTLYGRMTTYYNTKTGNVTKFIGGLNVGNPNITGSNVTTSTATHEVGHAMGLAHNSKNSIMNSARDRSKLWFPTSYDVETMNEIYEDTIGWDSAATILPQPKITATDVNLSYDFPVTDELKDMVSESDVIVIGKYQEGYEKWNMLRELEDIHKESSEGFVEGRLFDFKINKIIKGDLTEDSIVINHRVSETINVDISEKAEGKVTFPDPKFVNPETNETYLLFLKQNKELKNYYGAIEPFSVTIDDNNSVLLQSNLIDEKEISQSIKVTEDFMAHSNAEEFIEDSITGMKLDELLEKIQFLKN